jgi:hypothetical protein
MHACHRDTAEVTIHTFAVKISMPCLWDHQPQYFAGCQHPEPSNALAVRIYNQHIAGIAALCQPHSAAAVYNQSPQLPCYPATFKNPVTKAMQTCLTAAVSSHTTRLHLLHRVSERPELPRNPTSFCSANIKSHADKYGRSCLQSKQTAAQKRNLYRDPMITPAKPRFSAAVKLQQSPNWLQT